ncbi:unnamed protein product [Dovyalis caffra]|uniref:Uncharacterized protein n=1 Tax=Dovyalis caffra TaxID=77055 RepID=A0AAV1RIU2_9ROSI|nr:unnamed protein product [Dovyalis caffra]
MPPRTKPPIERKPKGQSGKGKEAALLEPQPDLVAQFGAPFTIYSRKKVLHLKKLDDDQVFYLTKYT